MSLSDVTAHDAPDEQPPGSAEIILAAARQLFSERGYNTVTIRDIAAMAKLSPALVMKYGGSKRELFARAATLTPLPLPDVALSVLGHELVKQVIGRAEDGAIEPLTRALVLRLTGPDPTDVRARFQTAYVEPMAARLGSTPEARLRAELVAAALTGLAISLRIYELPPPPDGTARIAELYGEFLQEIITGAPHPVTRRADADDQ